MSDNYMLTTEPLLVELTEQLRARGFSFPDREATKTNSLAVVSASGAYLWLDVTEDGRVLGFDRYGANDPTALIEALQALGYRVVSEHEEEWFGLYSRGRSKP